MEVVVPHRCGVIAPVVARMRNHPRRRPGPLDGRRRAPEAPRRQITVPPPFAGATTPPVHTADTPVLVAVVPVPVTAVPVAVTAVPVAVTVVPVPVTAVPVAVTAVPVAVTAVPVAVTAVPVPVAVVPVPVTAVPVAVPTVPVAVPTVPVAVPGALAWAGVPFWASWASWPGLAVEVATALSWIRWDRGAGVGTRHTGASPPERAKAQSARDRCCS